MAKGSKGNVSAQVYANQPLLSPAALSPAAPLSRATASATAPAGPRVPRVRRLPSGAVAMSAQGGSAPRRAPQSLHPPKGRARWSQRQREEPATRPTRHPAPPPPLLQHRYRSASPGEPWFPFRRQMATHVASPSPEPQRLPGPGLSARSGRSVYSTRSLKLLPSLCFLAPLLARRGSLAARHQLAAAPPPQQKQKKSDARMLRQPANRQLF